MNSRVEMGGDSLSFFLRRVRYPVPLTIFLEKTVRLAFKRSKMQVLWLRLITFSSLVCLTLAKEANYNEAEQSLPRNEWLNPWDMIHYDAAAQSFDNTVSLLLISHLFTSLTNYKLKVFFAEPANLLNVTLFLSLCIVFLVFFSVNFLATRCANWFPVETL